MPTSLLENPINTILFLISLHTLYRIIFPSTLQFSTPPTEFKSGYSWMPKAHPPTVVYKTYTPRTLAPFNGEGEGGRILLAINGIVFDVTAGRGFYGPS
jgi:membrane-associated progesterone receptor component